MIGNKRGGFSLVDRIEPKEWSFVFLLSAFVLLITIIPIIVGYLRQSELYRFVGFVNPHEDMNSYFSWMKQAQKGYFLFEEKYTTEPQPRNIFNLYFLIAGMFSQYLHVPLVIMHHLMRLACGMALLLASYLFCAYFIKDVVKRKIAFVLICFSGGFGFYFSVLYHFFGFELPPLMQIPCDQVHPQAITFWGIDWFAHAELSIAMMLLIFLLVLESYRTANTAYSIYAALLTMIIILFHPYRVITILCALGLYGTYLLFKNKNALRNVIFSYLILLAFSMFGYIFVIYQLMKNPIIVEWYKLKQPYFYNILGYLLGNGFVIITAIFAVIKILMEKIEEYFFLIIWSFTMLLFLQVPFITFRMRLVEGLHIGLSILSTLALFWFLEKRGWFKEGALKRAGVIFLALFILFSLPSNLMHIIVDIRTARQVKYPYFLSKDLDNLLDWMDKHLSASGTVLASREVGSFIPSRSGLKTFIGQVSETLDKHRKLDELKKFMDDKTSDQFRLGLFKKNNINYFIFSDFEKYLGDFNPDNAKYLKQIYRSGPVILYEVSVAGPGRGEV